ncbi:hypothetical protein [Stenoxybacter acetivorans]|nr:hypothetical protein [Stenoxybacter acetivorans]
MRLYQEQQQHHHRTRWTAMRSVAEKIGCCVKTLRTWVKQAEINQIGW